MLIAAGHDVRSSDIQASDYTFEVFDFLKGDQDWNGAIVTNPPYTEAEEFCRKAVAATKRFGGQVAMLLRNEFDSAASRRDLFVHPFSYKLILTQRPKWVADHKASPRHNFAWFIWDWLHEGEPLIRYQQKSVKVEAE